MSYERYGALQRAAEREAGSAPCRGCTERYEACAGHCEKYKAWKQKYLDSKQKIMGKDSGARMADDARIRSFTRISEARRRRTKLG